jgi:hypothetical protein
MYIWCRYNYLQHFKYWVSAIRLNHTSGTASYPLLKKLHTATVQLLGTDYSRSDTTRISDRKTILKLFALPHHRTSSYVFSSPVVYVPKSACRINENNKAHEITASDYRRPSQWPGGLRRGSAAARFLGLRFRIPSGAWMSVSFECCV